MAKRSVVVALGPVLGLALALALGACDRGPSVAYTTPGWYLERPRLLLVSGPEIFAGPFTYEQCEAERMKFPDDTARRLLCIPEKTKPGRYGPYSPAAAMPSSS